MTDNPLLMFSMIILLVVNVIQGLRFNSVVEKVTFLTKIFPKEQEREFTEEEKQTIVRLAGDMNLLIYQSNAVNTLIIISLLFSFVALIALILFPINQLLSTIVALPFTIFFYWSSNIVNKKQDVIIKARDLYIEDKEINAEFDSDFDETEYLLSSPENAKRLKQAIKEVETGQCVSRNLDYGDKKAVVISLQSYLRLQEIVEEYEAIQAYDAAKAEADEVIPFITAEESFKQGWQEVKQGKIYHLKNLWKNME